ncbi:VOC family protein [Methylocella sp.]|uniref:VOC family protein n=1 Tax=Methylocella sp. TaxID=1978226 RepID=UPI00378500E2
MGNPFVHVELSTTDVGKAKTFYQSLFAWDLHDMSFGPDKVYTLIGVGEGTGGGMMASPVPGMPSAWMPYVLVDDVAAAAQKAVALGGTVCVEKMEVPEMGYFAVVTDPTGATFGLWQNGTR